MGAVDFIVVVDTHEQVPFRFIERTTVRAHLSTGDYSVLGYEHFIAIERKSVDDLLGSYGKERDRFFREIVRLSTIPHAIIIVEGSVEQALDARSFDGISKRRILPSQFIGTTIAIMAKYGIPVLFAGNRENAEMAADRFLLMSLESCNGRYSFLESGLMRSARLSACSACGVSQHEIIATGGSFDGWRCARNDAGKVVAFCSSCGGDKPKGYRWAPNGSILAGAEARGKHLPRPSRSRFSRRRSGGRPVGKARR